MPNLVTQPKLKFLQFLKKLLKKIRTTLCEFRVTDKMIPGTYYKVSTKKLKTLCFEITNFLLGQIA